MDLGKNFASHYVQVILDTVIKISGREFTIDNGSREIKVDIINMPYNPLDDKSYQKIKVDDFVQITDSIDVIFFLEKGKYG